MMEMVIDASATVPLLLDDERGNIVPEVLEGILAGTCIAPGIWPWEIANIIWKARRAKRIKPEEIEAIRSLLASFAICTDQESASLALTRTLDLAIEHQLTAYDAAYLELAIRRRAVLASYDADLRKAALGEGISVLPA